MLLTGKRVHLQMGEQKNLFVALGLSLLVMLLFDTFYMKPKLEEQQVAYEAALAAQQRQAPAATLADDGVPQATAIEQGVASLSTVEDALTQSKRITIETPELFGSISLQGLRIDDISLVNHFDTMDKDTRTNIRLFEPKGTEKAYYAQFGWASLNRSAGFLPSSSTVWTTDNDKLTPSTPVSFSWDNGQGYKFITRVEVDDEFMFTIEQSVVNSTDNDVILSPYGYVSRRGLPDVQGLYILHEGPIGVFDGVLETQTYSDLEDGYDDAYDDLSPQAKYDPSAIRKIENIFDYKNTNGWMGITDKYWMAIMVPEPTAQIETASFKRSTRDNNLNHQVNYIEVGQTLAARSTISNTTHLYAGAKIVGAIDSYEEQYNITLFNRTVDWGWFHFITRPMFKALSWLFSVAGNFGVAILLLTVLVKLILFPIANKGYRSMSRMKKVGPRIKEMQKRYADDKPKLQQEMMALYKTEKINPLSGCLPMLVQIPIFFSLYKVLYVTIDMRHQPFFGWIKDLSASDPLTPLNLFGMIPWDPPSMIAIGIWPILMGLTMWLQQKLNPSTGMDPAQAKVMAMLPIIFTFILAQFSAGLVIYWTWNSALSILQQWVIMRREGVKISD